MRAKIDLVVLRDVELPVPVANSDDTWMTLADAETARVDLAYVRDGIGPRRRGMVYRGGYTNDVSTVHNVFVRVVRADRDPETGKFRPRRATWWQVAEESAEDNGRVRRHCTSWEYDRRNRRNTPLLTFIGF